MKRSSVLFLPIACLIAVTVLSAPALAQSTRDISTLRGVVTDPSGASIPGAIVNVRGNGATVRAATNETGAYSFHGLKSGKYKVYCSGHYGRFRPV